MTSSGPNDITQVESAPRPVVSRPSACGQIIKRQSNESPQMRVGSGGASSMPPQQRNSIEINAPGEWKP